MAKRPRTCNATLQPAIEASNSNWTHERTLKFIELFKKHPNLWDRACPDYRKSGPRTDSLREISEELNVTVKVLAKKIHRMQTAFSSYWKKTKIAAANGSKISINNWPYYEQMKFFEKSYRIFDESRAEKDKTNRRRRPPKQSKVVEHSESVRDCNGVTKEECIISDDEDGWVDDCYVIPTQYECNQMIPTSTTVAASAVSTRVATMSSATPQNNERIDAFFRAMGDTVKSFPHKNVAEIKLRISQMIGEMELALASEEEVLVSNF